MVDSHCVSLFELSDISVLNEFVEREIEISGILIADNEVCYLTKDPGMWKSCPIMIQLLGVNPLVDLSFIPCRLGGRYIWEERAIVRGTVKRGVGAGIALVGDFFIKVEDGEASIESLVRTKKS